MSRATIATQSSSPSSSRPHHAQRRHGDGPPGDTLQHRSRRARCRRWPRRLEPPADEALAVLEQLAQPPAAARGAVVGSSTWARAALVCRISPLGRKMATKSDVASSICSRRSDSVRASTSAVTSSRATITPTGWSRASRWGATRTRIARLGAPSGRLERQRESSVAAAAPTRPPATSASTSRRGLGRDPVAPVGGVVGLAEAEQRPGRPG